MRVSAVTMLASCASRELLANPFRTSPTETPIKTAYEPVVIAQPTPERASLHTCSNGTPSEKTSSDKPWLTDEVKAAIEKKNKLYHAARESNDPKDWAAFKRQRFAIGKLIRATRPARERKLTQQPKSDFYCDPCESGFVDQAEYDDHVSQHVSCEHGGCRFSACPKLVELHRKLQHDTGLVRRLFTDSPEDATEWIKQRRARYPTLRNIAAKKAQEKEMRARKEVLKTKTWKRRCKRPQRRRRGHGRKNAENKVFQKEEPANVAAVKEEVVEQPDCSLVMFRGTGEMDEVQLEEPEQEEKEEGQITDSDSDRPAAPVKKEIEVAGALRSLIACYGSSSEDEEPEGRPPAVLPAKADPPPKPAVSEAPVPTQSKPQRRQAKRRAPVQGKVPHISKRRLTLLEKLLANEIRHERNVLLQCVHYVVKNRFFEQVQDRRGAPAEFNTGGERRENGKVGISVTAAGSKHVPNNVESNGAHQGSAEESGRDEHRALQHIESTVEDRCIKPRANVGEDDAMETDGRRGGIASTAREIGDAEDGGIRWAVSKNGADFDGSQWRREPVETVPHAQNGGVAKRSERAL